MKKVQKGVYRNDGVFLLWDCIESAPEQSIIHYSFIQEFSSMLFLFVL